MGLSRKCLVPTCEVYVSGSHLMCLKHWKKVPQRIRKGVYERNIGWNSRASAEEFLSGEARRIAAAETSGPAAHV